jgi:hypothetical protein
MTITRFQPHTHIQTCIRNRLWQTAQPISGINVMNERYGTRNHRFRLLITKIQPVQKVRPHLTIPTLVQKWFLLPLNQFLEYSTVSELNPLTHVMQETMEPNNHQFWLLLTNLESVILFQAKQKIVKIENLQVQTCCQCNSSLIFKFLAGVALPITSPVQ